MSITKTKITPAQNAVLAALTVTLHVTGKNEARITDVATECAGWSDHRVSCVAASLERRGILEKRGGMIWWANGAGPSTVAVELDSYQAMILGGTR